MIKYILKQCKIDGSPIEGKWFAYPVIEETLDLDGLAKHMSQHNTPYSVGVIRGVFTDMVRCIKEQLLEGKNVKIGDLAIFSVGIRNSKGGAASEDEFTVSKNIQGVKLRARATGELSNKVLNLEATLKKATVLVNGQTIGEGDTSDDDDANSGTTTGGSDNTGGSGTTTGGSGDTGGSGSGSDSGNSGGTDDNGAGDQD